MGSDLTEDQPLKDPVDLRVKIPQGPELVVHVERQILEWWGQFGRTAIRIEARNAGGEEATPSEWFIGTVHGAVADLYREEIADGADSMAAASLAVLTVTNYHVPALWVGKVLEVREHTDPESAANLERMLVDYLAAHPVQLANLADPEHINAVPSLREPLRRVLREARRRRGQR